MLTENRRHFLVLASVTFAAMALYILFVPKGTESIYCYHHQRSGFTLFFTIITRFGEWIPISLVGLYLLWARRFRVLMSGLLAFIPINMLMHGLKRYLDRPRPLLYFQHGEIIALPDMTPLYHGSLPSGHSFTAFFTASFLIYFFDLSMKYQLLLWGLAMLVGISRIYLLCHFTEDVLLGGMMGFMAGLVPTWIYSKLGKGL